MSVRLSLALALAAAFALVAPAAAPARILELGTTTDAATPACPGNPCLAIAHTTGFPVRSATRRNLMVVPKTIDGRPLTEGRVFGFEITLSKPTQQQIEFFNNRTGGPATARISVIKPYRRTNNQFRFVLNAQSEDFALEPFFGSTVQLFLAKTRSLKVKPGYIVALTVPTWAPALGTGLSDPNSWRASRVKPCADTTLSQLPQTMPGSMTQYFCNYRRERPLYKALIGISEPTPATAPAATSNKTTKAKRSPRSGETGGLSAP